MKRSRGTKSAEAGHDRTITVRWNLRLGSPTAAPVISQLGSFALENLAQVLAFDVAAPLAAVATLLIIGVMLGCTVVSVSLLGVYMPADHCRPSTINRGSLPA